MSNKWAPALADADRGVRHPVHGGRLPQVSTMRVLGVTQSAEDPRATAVEARSQAAWANFRARLPLFRHRSACRFARLRMLELVIRPTLLWGITAFALRSAEQDLLRRTFSFMDLWFASLFLLVFINSLLIFIDLY